MHCLLLAAWAALGPAFAQAPDTLEVRRSRLLAMVVEYGQAHYDEAAHLVRDAANLPTIAEGSLAYAVALLATGSDTDRAVAVIDAVLAAQSPGDKTAPRGAFPWRPGEAITDQAATAAVGPWLAYLHRHFRDKLPAETQSRLDAALPAALSALSHMTVDPARPSAFLSKTAAEATLSAEVSGGSARNGWPEQLAEWARFTERSGLGEMNSPSYAARSLEALQWLWLVAADDQAKAPPADALAYLYRDLALRYQPKAGRLAGAEARALDLDYLGLSATCYLFYAQFGEPPPRNAVPFATFLALPGFVPSAETVQTATQLDAPRLIRARGPEGAFTTYLHPRYALGVMTGPLTAETSPVVMTYPQRDEPSAYCTCRPATGRVTAVEDNGKALVSMDFDQIGAADRTVVEVDFHLGSESSLKTVLVNDTPYYEAGGSSNPTYPVVIDAQASVITEREGVFTAITPILVGPAASKAWDPPPGKPGLLEWAETPPAGRELVLRLAARTDARRQPARDNYRVIFAVEMASTDAYLTVQKFAEAMYKTRARKNLSAKTVKVGERGGNPHQPPGFMKPVERGDWIMELRVVQELSYQSGDDLLALSEDLEKNQVIVQQVDGKDLAWDFLYRSPSLNQMPGDPLSSVLRPPPPPPEPTAEPATPPPAGKKKHH